MSNPRIPFELFDRRPRLAPPGGKPLIVHVVVNVEHWRFDRPMPRTALTPPHGAAAVPDVPNFAWAEYGMRVGMPRLLALFGERGLPASCALNASVIDAYPALAEAVRGAGWEFVGHGMDQKALQAEEDEAAVIEAALSKIAAFAGARPRGWLGPGLGESARTPDLLRAAGVEYVFDWPVDDLPCWMDTAHGRLLALPYTLELNDSPIYAGDRHSSAEIRRRLMDTLACWEAGLADQPRVLTLALHPHLIGAPHRFVHLVEMLDVLQRRNDAVFMTGAGIAGWFSAAEEAALAGGRTPAGGA